MTYGGSNFRPFSSIFFLILCTGNSSVRATSHTHELTTFIFGTECVMVCHGGTWWGVVCHGGTWWGIVGHGGTWCVIVVHGGTWWCMVGHGKVG